MPPLARAADEEPLPPDQVYKLAVTPQAGQLLAHWDILPGYYLYKSKFRFISHTDAVTLGAPQLPAGETKQDPYFGKQEVYHQGITATVPYTGGGPLDLEVVYQGCADKGFCYPPQHTRLHLTLADADGATNAVHPPDLQSLIAGGASSDQNFPPPDRVFQFSAIVKDANTLEVRWHIEDGYYLYRQKFHFGSDNPDVSLGVPDFPQGQIKNDAYFGTSEIYTHDVDALIPITRSNDASRFTFTAGYQGCAEKGFCYPPITKTITLDLGVPGGSAAEATAVPGGNAAPVSEQDRLAQFIRSGNLALVFLAFIGLGLLLTFTPCVLPMIPILSGLIVGQHQKPSTLRAFVLSLIYVLAMALTYTVAGVVVGLAGANVQAWFQNPWIIGVFSALFVGLALSMFGLYELQMPGFLQSHLTRISNNQQSGALVGVAVMGVLSALIVGPCITAPLVAALLVISESGDPVRGGLTLFATGLGMGVPLLIIGTSAGRFLPKAGKWMETVKHVLGVVMLGVAIWFLSRVVPGPVTLALWAALLVICGVYLGALDPLHANASGWRKLWKGLGVLSLVYGLVLMVGAAFGGDDPLRPFARASFASPAPAAGGVTQTVTGLKFTHVKTVADLDRAVAQASAEGKPVMLDFYADWCVSCKEMEHDTYADPRVRSALADAVLLQSDVTANDAADQALMKRFGIYGPPSVIFFSAAGQELEADRVVGYMGPDEFLARLHTAFTSSAE